MVAEVKIPNDVLLASRRYEEIKQSMKLLEAEANGLKPTILNYLQESGQDIALDEGTIILKEGKTKWVFSENVEEAEKKVDEMKESEKRKGIAKEEAGTPYVEYRMKK